MSEREGGAGGRFFFFPGHLSLTLASHAHTHTSAALAFSAALLAATTATPLPAFARNATAAAEAAVSLMQNVTLGGTGKDAGEPEAFQSSASVPEDHSPNSHSHQEEGAKTSGGG